MFLVKGHVNGPGLAASQTYLPTLAGLRRNVFQLPHVLNAPITILRAASTTGPMLFARLGVNVFPLAPDVPVVRCVFVRQPANYPAKEFHGFVALGF